MKASYTFAALMCFYLCTGALSAAHEAAAVMSSPILEDEPDGMRRLQAVLGDDLLEAAKDALNEAVHAAEAMQGTVPSKVQGTPSTTPDAAEAAAHAANRITRADTRLANAVASATSNALKAETKAAAASATAISVRAWNAATPNKYPIKKVVVGVAEFATGVNAKLQTQEATRIAAKGAKRVKRAMAKAADSKSDALEDAAEAVARAARRAVIKAGTAEKRAMMAITQAASENADQHHEPLLLP